MFPRFEKTCVVSVSQLLVERGYPTETYTYSASIKRSARKSAKGVERVGMPLYVPLCAVKAFKKIVFEEICPTTVLISTSFSYKVIPNTKTSVGNSIRMFKKILRVQQYFQEVYNRLV